MVRTQEDMASMRSEMTQTMTLFTLAIAVVFLQTMGIMIERRGPSIFLAQHDAHLGHIDGLGQFGTEVMNTSEVPLHCSPAVADILRTTPAWHALLDRGNLLPPDLRARYRRDDVDRVLGSLFGGVAFALYPLCVAHTNDHIEAHERVGASGGLVLLYSLGAVAGPLVGSLAMAMAGPAGLFGAIGATALLGAVLGRAGWAELVVGTYAPFLLFAVPGLLLALVRRDRRLLRAAYPFGPFMVVGALLGVLVGPALVGLITA